VSFIDVDIRRLAFACGRKSKYVCSRTVKENDILRGQNTLATSVSCHLCSLISSEPHVSLNFNNAINLLQKVSDMKYGMFLVSCPSARQFYRIECLRRPRYLVAFAAVRHTKDKNTCMPMSHSVCCSTCPWTVPFLSAIYRTQPTRFRPRCAPLITCLWLGASLTRDSRESVMARRVIASRSQTVSYCSMLSLQCHPTTLQVW
jgi:hypothetical protein